MKKFLAAALATTMICTMVGCGNKQENNQSAEGDKTTTVSQQPTTQAQAGQQSNSSMTLGNTLLGAFNDLMAKDDKQNSLALAEKLIGNESIGFSGGAQAVQPGLLSGFGNYEVKGFKEGAMFAPVIGSIPFVGYVFILPDGANVDEFVNGLKSNADPRWNVCVEAEEVVVEAKGNTVFFLMCPRSLDQ